MHWVMSFWLMKTVLIWMKQQLRPQFQKVFPLTRRTRWKLFLFIFSMQNGKDFMLHHQPGNLKGIKNKERLCHYFGNPLKPSFLCWTVVSLPLLYPPFLLEPGVVLIFFSCPCHPHHSDHFKVPVHRLFFLSIPEIIFINTIIAHLFKSLVTGSWSMYVISMFRRSQIPDLNVLLSYGFWIDSHCLWVHA